MSSLNDSVCSTNEDSSRKKVKPRSIAWNYFTKSSGKSTCNTCNSVYNITNTSAMLKHLRSAHPEITNVNSSVPFGQNEVSFIKRTFSFYYVNQNYDLVFDIATLVAQDGYSFYSISKSKFIQRTLYSVYKVELRSPNTVRNLFTIFADFIKIRMKNYIQRMKQEQKKCQIIFDEASTLSMMKLIGIYCLFEPNKYLNLGVVQISEKSTAVNIIKVIRDKLLWYGIDIEKDVSVSITDGCNTMLLIGHLLPGFHQICGDHLIQLCINDVIYEKDKNNNMPNSDGRVNAASTGEFKSTIINFHLF